MVQKKRRTVKRKVTKVQGSRSEARRDLLVVEEPLTILWQAKDSKPQRFAATMRTPGQDNELTAGLLFSEGLLRSKTELELISYCTGGGPNELNRLKAQLRLDAVTCQARLVHRPSQALPQSACGLCSNEELGDPAQLLEWAAGHLPSGHQSLSPTQSLLHQALDRLEGQCEVFAATGASHGCVILDCRGELLQAAEDVGRHNACDKAIGSLLLSGNADQPFRLDEGSGILFSSRLSFELAAKAVRAGAAWMASVGAPTHLAVELAQRCEIPLMGFLTKSRHNVY